MVVNSFDGDSYIVMVCCRESKYLFHKTMYLHVSCVCSGILFSWRRIVGIVIREMSVKSPPLQRNFWSVISPFLCPFAHKRSWNLMWPCFAFPRCFVILYKTGEFKICRWGSPFKDEMAFVSGIVNCHPKSGQRRMTVLVNCYIVKFLSPFCPYFLFCLCVYFSTPPPLLPFFVACRWIAWSLLVPTLPGWWVRVANSLSR